MPEDFKPKRRLAAIVFTDIVGFTKLTAADQSKAAALLVKQRELLKPMVESMNGKWVKEMGDGLLLIFDTVTDAVECCIEIQKILKPIKHLNLRIGIREGEILITENDVIGDDVNIAARIEPFSAEGGIAISNKVNDAIVREENFETKYLGKPKLKGVGQTVEVYCIISHGLPETNLSKVSAKLERTTPIWMIVVPALLVIGIAGYFIMPKKPKVVSVAVMYMEIIGNKEDQFLETITEDIIFNLSKALPGNLMVSEVSAVRKLKNTDMEVADIATSDQEGWRREQPDIEWSSRITIPLQAGDCTFHHGMTFHTAGPNQSDQWRVAHVVIFIEAQATYNGQRHIVTDPLDLPVGVSPPNDICPPV